MAIRAAAASPGLVANITARRAPQASRPLQSKSGMSYFEAESEAPTAAWPAASRAVSTRYGEQLT